MSTPTLETLVDKLTARVVVLEYRLNALSRDLRHGLLPLDSDTLPVPELTCPSCGATVRATMTDEQRS